MLDEKGIPTIVQRANVLPPRSSMNAVAPETISQNISQNPLYHKYAKAEDRESAYEELTEEEKALYAEYENALGGMRNEDMLAVAQDYLNSGKTVFYAVGLAHLLADDGLVNTLRNAGYTVEPVTYAG